MVASYCKICRQFDSKCGTVVQCAVAETTRLRDEADRLTAENATLKGAIWVCPENHGDKIEALARAACVDSDRRLKDDGRAALRAEIARLDALSRATAEAEAADETENQA